MSLGLVDAPASTHSWGCKRSDRLLGILAAAGRIGCSSFGLHSLVLLMSSCLLLSINSKRSSDASQLIKANAERGVKHLRIKRFEISLRDHWGIKITRNVLFTSWTVLKPVRSSWSAVLHTTARAAETNGRTGCFVLGRSLAQQLPPLLTLDLSSLPRAGLHSPRNRISRLDYTRLVR